jgi:hypothetical protein
MAASFIGTIEPFNASTTEWDTYERIFTNFLKVNKIDEPADEAAEDRRKAMLFAVIGSKTVQLLTSLCVPADPDSKTFAELLKLLKDHFKPKTTVFAARHVFHARKQKDSENIAEYTADLRRLVAKCDYSNTNIESQLIEQLTEGVLNDTIRKKLIEKLDNLPVVERTFANVRSYREWRLLIRILVSRLVTVM